MRIGIEARGLTGARGVRTYVENLVEGLIRISSDNEFHLWLTEQSELSVSPQTHVLPLQHELLLPFWLHRALPNALHKVELDIMHFTKSDVPNRKLSMPTVATVFDVIPLLLPQTQSVVRGLYWPRAYKRVATLSDHIITISEASKKYIVEHLDVSPDQITTTPLAVNLGHFSPSGSRPSAVPEKYILFVGRWDMRKNIPALMRAYSAVSREIPHQLVIAGRPADRAIDLRRTAQELEIETKVHFMENVSYDDLPALYSGADLFVFPSIVEGWGFPPLEAMACGTPVIVSDGDPMGEVVGQAARVVPFSTDRLSDRFVDTDFDQRLAQEIVSLLGNSSVRNKMVETGLSHVKQFSWDSVAQKTLGVYKRLA